MRYNVRSTKARGIISVSTVRRVCVMKCGTKVLRLRDGRRFIPDLRVFAASPSWLACWSPSLGVTGCGGHGCVVLSHLGVVAYESVWGVGRNGRDGCYWVTLRVWDGETDGRYDVGVHLSMHDPRAELWKGGNRQVAEVENYCVRSGIAPG